MGSWMAWCGFIQNLEESTPKRQYSRDLLERYGRKFEMSEIFADGEKAIREIVAEKERLSEAVSSLREVVAASDPLKSVSLEINNNLSKIEGSINELSDAVKKFEEQQKGLLKGIEALLETRDSQISDRFLQISEQLKAMEQAVIAEMPITFMGKRGRG